MEELETLGFLRGKVQTLETEMGLVRKDVADIKQMIAAAKGGWKTLVALSTASASLGAGVATVVGWMRHP